MRRPARCLSIFIALLALVLGSAAVHGQSANEGVNADHLLLWQVVVTPTDGEFVEIHNPTGATIDLSDVYLTDATFAGGGTFYYNVVTGTNAGGGGFGDFHARFPDGASIGPGQTQCVAMTGSTPFNATYGILPTYELFEDDMAADAVLDMREALPGSINGQGGLTNSGEVAILYTWDGASDLVQDLDYLVWGDKVEAVDKTGITVSGPGGGKGGSTYLDDTAIASQAVVATGAHSIGDAWLRSALDEGTETGTGGNGITGDDETSENIDVTWIETTVLPTCDPVGTPELLISEIVVTPTVGEFIEIYNPNPFDVDLSDVYLTDATFAGGGNFYYNIVTGTNAGGGGFADFHARFPDGAMIPANGFQTIAMAGSEDFFTEYGIEPDYELFEDGVMPDEVPDMREAIAGSINNQGGLTNAGEVVILYTWDGASDLVQDLDYAVWGDKEEAVDKTGVMIDGPDADMDNSSYLADTVIGTQEVVSGGSHADGESFTRDDLSEGTETQTGGNGVDGDDETSENLATTWSVAMAATPGLGAPEGTTLSIDDVDANEGNSPSTTTFTFTISLSAPAPVGGVSFDIATSDGTATVADSDYAANSAIGATITEGLSNTTFDVTVNGDDTFEADETFTVTVSNVVGTNVSLADGTGQGVIRNDDGAVVEIFQIQGDGLDSPFSEQIVTTNDNIVTAVAPDGFCMQTPDARDDADPLTSNGIFVFTDSAPGVAVGDQVDVSGLVEEFFGLTEITSTPTVTVDSSGNPLPAFVSFDTTTPSRDPATFSCGAAGNFECFEGMRVEIPSGVVGGPNLSFGTDPIAEVQIRAGTTRAFREPGLIFPGMMGLPVWDGNPEVFEMDIDRLGLPGQTLTAGTTFAATGCIGFEFGDYELWIDSLAIDQAAALPVAVPPAAADQMTIGSLNFFRLFDDVDDPGGQDNGQVATTMEYQTRLEKFSRYIREVLGSPDVLAVQEVESLTVLNDLAARIAADDATVPYVAALVEGNDVGGIDVGYLVRDDRVAIDAVVQLGAAEILTFDGSLLHDRPPLRLEARYTAGGANFAFAILNNHTRSLGGIDDPGDGPRVRQKRLEQAQSIAQMVQDWQTTPMSAATPMFVVGDLNAYEFTDGFVDVVGQIAGRAVAADNLLSDPNLTDPPLVNDVTLFLPPEERYSFVFDGSAQVLDHALHTSTAAAYVRGFAYGRGNADAARILLDDNTTALRSSDHDGFVLYVSFDETNDVFFDGFESSDTSAWSNTVP
ncbi:MAG: Calx-beta domain-containing protein [Acidobacteriota bacterium]